VPTETAAPSTQNHTMCQHMTDITSPGSPEGRQVPCQLACTLSSQGRLYIVSVRCLLLEY
jgi:hypothetical protein